jgi:hypothetical protein
VRRLSPRLSFHDCCYDIFFGWCLYSPWATCSQVCCRCDMETLLPSSKHISMCDIHLYNVVRVPMQQQQLHCYMHWGLGACCCILHASLSTHDNTAAKYVTAFDTGKCVHLLSTWRKGLSDGCSAVRESILYNGYWQMSTEKSVLGSSSQLSVSNLPFPQSAVPIHSTSNMNCHFPCEDSSFI